MNNACTFLSEKPLLLQSPLLQALSRRPCVREGFFAPSLLKPKECANKHFSSGASDCTRRGKFLDYKRHPRRDGIARNLVHYGHIRDLHVGPSTLKSPARRPAPSNPSRASPSGRKVPIPFGNVGKKELDKIFGHDMVYEEGNKMLQIIHSRRVTGALVDQGVYIKGTHTVPPEALTRGLEWLRAKYPVDEQAAADAWAEQEARRLEGTYIARAEKLGLYKPLDQEETPELSTKSVYGNDSVLDEFKRFHEARREREAKERKASGEEQRSQELQIAKRVEAEHTQELRMKRIEEKRELRAKRGMITEDTTPPEMSLFRRLFPSTALGLLIIGGVIVLGSTYTPPPQSLRFFPDTPTAVATIAGIMAPSVLIYVLWKVPPLWRTLNKYFRQSPGLPYALGVFGNIFSHPTMSHLAANMAGIWFYGTRLHEDIGRGNWVTIYLTGGIFGSLCSLWAHTLTRRFDVTTYGASGAAWAIMAAWAYITIGKPAPSTETWDFAIVASQWAVLGLQVLLHFTPGVMSRIDVASHVGGALVGYLGASLVTRGAAKRKGEDVKPDVES